MKLSVREMVSDDARLVVNYFLNATPEYILSLGAWPDKMPERNKWIEIIQTECQKPYSEKKFYYIIWLMNGSPVGHSNISDIHFGKDAHMHLHLWQSLNRRKGNAALFLEKAIPYFFSNFELKKLICEPYALNPAPIKTLESVGFDFIREYETTPGWINYVQLVKRFELGYQNFQKQSRQL